jgi:hypothetical protein
MGVSHSSPPFPIVHARNRERLAAVRDLVDRGAMTVVGDLSDPGQTRDIAAQVNRLGHIGAVIHNAGVYSGSKVLPVNIVAPYLLTALIDRPQRLIYISSGMHRGGRALLTGIDWSGDRAFPCPFTNRRFANARSTDARTCDRPREMLVNYAPPR